MVRPKKLQHLIIEILIVISPIARVDYKVVVIMFLMQKSDHIFNWVSICLLDARRGKGHSYDSIGDVCEI